VGFLLMACDRAVVVGRAPGFACAMACGRLGGRLLWNVAFCRDRQQFIASLGPFLINTTLTECDLGVSVDRIRSVGAFLGRG